MIRGPDGLIYIGSEPPYGELGGALGVWDPRQNRTIENYRHLVTNQSIVSLAWEPKSGLLFGGSGNYGGGGTRAVEKEARFFAFDPKKKREGLRGGAGSRGAQLRRPPCAAQGRSSPRWATGCSSSIRQSMRVIEDGRLPGAQVEISLGPARRGPRSWA